MTYLPQAVVVTGVGTPRIVKEFAVLFTSNAATTTYSGLSVVDSNGLSSLILPKMRIRGKQTGTLGDKGVWAKVVSVNVGTNTIAVDEWIGGVPTNGKAFTIDGWVGDLPRSQAMTETFTPDALRHEHYNFSIRSRLRGYRYRAEIRYDQFITQDGLNAVKEVLTHNPTDIEERLIFYPRKDKPGKNYNAFLEGDLRFRLHPSQEGHADFSIVLTGRDLESAPGQFIADNYGYGFASNYGHQL